MTQSWVDVPEKNAFLQAMRLRGSLRYFYDYYNEMESCVNVFYGILVLTLQALMNGKHPGLVESWLRGVLRKIIFMFEC